MEFWITRSKNESDTTFFTMWVRDDFNWLDTYETFLDVLEHTCNCKLLEDGHVVLNRRAKFEKDGYKFSFHHDPFEGGWLCVQDEEAIPIVEAVANDVIAELKKRAGIACE